MLKEIKGAGSGGETVCRWFCCAAASVFLLGFGPAGYRQITGAKLILFYAVWGSFLAALGFCALTGRLRLLRRPGPAQVLVLLYWLASLVSALASPWRREALLGGPRDEGLLTITLYAAAFLALSCFSVPGKRMLQVFAAAVTLNCLVALLQFMGLDPLGLYPEGLGWADRHTGYNGAFIGLTGNADFAAAILSLAFPLCWTAALRLKRPLYLIPALLSLLVLILGETKGGLLGAVCGSVLALPVVLPLGKTGRKRLRLGILCAAALGLALLWLLPLPGTLGEAHALLRGKAEDSFGSGRIYIWRNTLPLLRERLLTGGGPDTFSHRMTAVFTRIDENGKTIRRTIDCAHNEYLNILVNQGLPALLFYLAALLCSFVRWFRRRGDAAAALAGAALLCYALQAFFGISTPTCTGFFWIVWGLLEAAPEGKDGPSAEASVIDKEGSDMLL
jgi:putative inorganic carbon (HCO3(-)) transporter